VRAGAGVAIVDQFSVGGAGWPGVVVRPLRESIPLALSLVRSRFDTPSRHVQRFMRLLKEHVRDDMPEPSAVARDGIHASLPDGARQATAATVTPS